MPLQQYKDSLLKKAPNLQIKENQSLSAYTTFKIGGNSPLMVFPSTLEELTLTLQEAQSHDLPLFPLGNGSNLLVSDQGYQGIILNTKYLSNISQTSPQTLDVQSGCLLGKLAHFACEQSLSGLEFAQGIPGTLGGGIKMNAGAYGGELSEVIETVTSISLETGEIFTRPKKDLDFSYRHSLFSTEKELIISATLSLPQGNQEEIKETMKKFATQRREKQPLEFPSCGSTFKRPPNHFAAALIDQCNLKGFAIGDAAVSTKHAGFLINKGKATAEDMCKLIAHIQTTVAQTHRVYLELEVERLH